MTKVAILIGSTRPGRRGESIGRWVHQVAQQRDDATYDLLDLADFDLPLFDEPLPPAMGEPPAHEHTKHWSDAIASYDAFVMVTAEYNHSVPGALKNALDYLFAEWNDKAVGFVGYGSAGGTRAVEHTTGDTNPVVELRQIVGELKMADVRAQVMLQFGADFDESWDFKPRAFQGQAVGSMLEEVVRWGAALRGVRSAA